MSTTEGLLQCLVGTMNADAATRHQSEVQLQNFSVEHGFGLALLEVMQSLVTNAPLECLLDMSCPRQLLLQQGRRVSQLLSQHMRIRCGAPLHLQCKHPTFPLVVKCPCAHRALHVIARKPDSHPEPLAAAPLRPGRSTSAAARGGTVQAVHRRPLV